MRDETTTADAEPSTPPGPASIDRLSAAPVTARSPTCSDFADVSARAQSSARGIRHDPGPDGSSFVVKESLQAAFPGRFKNVDPAAVELHATFSGFLDEVTAVSLAPDKKAERQFLPEAAALTDKLLLADRGYPSVAYFLELCDAGASFIMRLSRSYKPRVTTVHHANAVERL